MESLVLVGSLILMGLTGTYAWLTYDLTRQLRQQVATQQTAIDHQLRLTTLPHLYCDLQSDAPPQTLQLEVYNVGAVPAYDVLLAVVATYTEETLDIPTLMRSFVQPRYRKYPLQVDKVGYYGIRSSVRQAVLPIQQKLAIALSLPARPVDVYALLQFRALSGDNYHQVYCFSELDEQGSYRANILDPQRGQPIDRLHLYDAQEDALPMTVEELPYPVMDFIDLWNHGISYRFTTLFNPATKNTDEPGTPPTRQASPSATEPAPPIDRIL